MTEILNACSSLERDVTRYAYGSDLAAQEKQAVEEHLQNCADCRELVAFIRQTRSVAQDKRVKPNARTPECLDVDTIALFEEGRLPAEIEERAREHILNCARCRDQYLLWCRMNAEEESLVSPAESGIIESIAEQKSATDVAYNARMSALYREAVLKEKKGIPTPADARDTEIESIMKSAENILAKRPRDLAIVLKALKEAAESIQQRKAASTHFISPKLSDTARRWAEQNPGTGPRDTKKH